LHDGAVIIDGGKVESAAVTITNISSQKLPKKFGTRHRSALGLSEEKDSIVVVLSEETQNVTIFKNGKYTQVKDLNEVRTEITNKLIENEKEEN
jgi:diadenylate cyclase